MQSVAVGSEFKLDTLIVNLTMDFGMQDLIRLSDRCKNKLQFTVHPNYAEQKQSITQDHLIKKTEIISCRQIDLIRIQRMPTTSHGVA